MNVHRSSKISWSCHIYNICRIHICGNGDSMNGGPAVKLTSCLLDKNTKLQKIHFLANHDVSLPRNLITRLTIYLINKLNSLNFNGTSYNYLWKQLVALFKITIGRLLQCTVFWLHCSFFGFLQRIRHSSLLRNQPTWTSGCSSREIHG